MAVSLPPPSLPFFHAQTYTLIYLLSINYASKLFAASREGRQTTKESVCLSTPLSSLLPPLPRPSGLCSDSRFEEKSGSAVCLFFLFQFVSLFLPTCRSGCRFFCRCGNGIAWTLLDLTSVISACFFVFTSQPSSHLLTSLTFLLSFIHAPRHQFSQAERQPTGHPRLVLIDRRRIDRQEGCFAGS